jgi:hypothetical protein
MADPSLCPSFFHFVAWCVVSPAGSLVGNLLPRLMLRERGVPVSSVEFAKTEANKSYISTVGFFLCLFQRGGTCGTGA